MAIYLKRLLSGMYMFESLSLILFIFASFYLFSNFLRYSFHSAFVMMRRDQYTASPAYISKSQSVGMLSLLWLNYRQKFLYEIAF